MSQFEKRFKHAVSGAIVTNVLQTPAGERRYDQNGMYWFVNAVTIATCIPANMVENTQDWVPQQPVAWMKPDGTFLHEVDPFTTEDEARPIWSVKELIELFRIDKMAWLTTMLLPEPDSVEVPVTSKQPVLT